MTSTMSCGIMETGLETLRIAFSPCVRIPPARKLSEFCVEISSVAT